MIHYAISDFTACGRHIIGHTFFLDFENHGRDSYGTDTENVNHSCCPSDVTCPQCRKHESFLKALEEQEEGN